MLSDTTRLGPDLAAWASVHGQTGWRHAGHVVQALYGDLLVKGTERTDPSGEVRWELAVVLPVGQPPGDRVSMLVRGEAMLRHGSSCSTFTSPPLRVFSRRDSCHITPAPAALFLVFPVRQVHPATTPHCCPPRPQRGSAGAVWSR